MAVYPVVIANIQMDSMTGFFSILGFVAIFYVIMVGLVNSCFSVMYLLPDAIFAFIGAHNSAASQTGRHEADNVKNAVGGGVAISRQGQARLDKVGAANRRKAKDDPGGTDGGVQQGKNAG